MSDLVGVRLHGHGKIVVPFAGVRIERHEGELLLRVEREGPGEGEVVDVRAPFGELSRVEEGTREGPWRIETSRFRCAWPEGFALAPDPSEMAPFLLLGPDDAMIWIDGPVDAARVTPIEKLAAPGQDVREVAEAGDAARIDLDYVEEGVRFWQRRFVIAWAEGRVLVPSAQARREDELVVRAALELVERTLEAVETA